MSYVLTLNNISQYFPTDQVRDQVYETLRRQGHLTSANPDAIMTSSSGSEDPGQSSSIKGIRSANLRPNCFNGSFGPSTGHPSQNSPPELPPPPENCSDLSELYAKVDPSKKKKNRASATSSR